MAKIARKRSQRNQKHEHLVSPHHEVHLSINPVQEVAHQVTLVKPVFHLLRKMTV